MSKFGDLMQNFIMSNPKRASWFLSHMPEEIWFKIGKKKVLDLFKKTVQIVPAYRHFLKENRVNPEVISSFADFKKLPLIDKKSYLLAYNLDEFCFKPPYKAYAITKSSGSSGRSLFWFRFADADKTIPSYLDFLFTNYWKVDKIPTLCVISLATGTWVAGMVMSDALRELVKKKGYPMTIITPGSDILENVEILTKLAPKYKQVVIIGYPPIITEIFHELEKHISLELIKKMNIKLFVGGEFFVEEWRENMLKKVGDKEDLTRIVGIFASSDTGILGFDTPLTVLVRKLALKDLTLRRSLFNSNRLPFICQYNPSGILIEEIEEEVVVTTSNGGTPLIRYNMHDRGGTIYFSDVLKKSFSCGYNLLGELFSRGYGKPWRLPLFYCFGRSDGISIDGANVYAEDVEIAIEENKLNEINNFKLGVKEQDNRLRFIILVELKRNTKIEIDKVKKYYHDVILSKLLELNSDFRDAYKNNPKSCDPLIQIYEFGEGPFAEDHKRIKQKHIL